MLMMNMIMLIMIHPLAITLMIIMQTLMICSISGMNSYSMWFSYILFMIFLGGMLVLFIYITSLASNELFLMPNKTIMYKLIMMFSMNMLMMAIINMLMNHNNKFDSMKLNMINKMMEMNNLNQLYNLPNFKLTIMTILYLLLTLIIITTITQFQEGPLRQSHY
uniref:NADH dehydrogenase subunit 6 n=1 Tax=Sclerogryllus punctatus TaxID=2985483 RepID=UPI00223824AC|nr:NADH dehydrogenase subunit 6 [Sclerogryllus punctatus]UYE92200.1 NADH dehydrogenase subunit 6 [Sclerogryllus punctatus]